jgi:hypothetical protein
MPASKGVGRVHQQTFVDTNSKVAFAKLYTTKTPITAGDLLNDKVMPFFEAEQLPMLRILTDRGNAGWTEEESPSLATDGLRNLAHPMVLDNGWLAAQSRLMK